MEIVVFAPSGKVPADALSEAAETDRVAVICWAGRQIPGCDHVTVPQSAAVARAVALLSRSMAGRMLVRVLPLDTGRRFWRATRRVADVAARVGSADLVVAAERDGGFAAWKWLQRRGKAGAAPDAVRGFAAARARMGVRR